MLNLEVIKILDNITSLLLSIKEKYAILFEIDINNLKDSKEYLEAVKGIKSLKYFVNEELKKISKNYSDITTIIKYLKEKYLDTKDDSLSLILPDKITIKNSVIIRLINTFIFYIINNFDELFLNPLMRKYTFDDEMKIKIIKDSSFVTSLQNYLMQDLLNILGQINYQSSNPLLKNVLIHNFYDLCYVIPFIEDKMLQSNFSFVNDYIVSSDIINYFYGISSDTSKEASAAFLKKYYLKYLEKLISFDNEDTLSVDKLFEIEFAKNIMKSILLLGSKDLEEELIALSYAYISEDGSLECINTTIKDIIDNENAINLSRLSILSN